MEIDKPTLELLKQMNFIPSKKDPKLYETAIDGGKAYVDFRRVDGRRYAMVNNKPVDDEDSIPILKAFKDERKKIEDALLQKIGADKQTESHENKLDSKIQQHAGVKSSSDKKNESCINSPMGNSHTPATTNKEQQPKPPAASQSSGGTVFTNSMIPTPPPAPDTKPRTKNVFLHDMIPAYDIDICEIFGNAGSGKSQFAKQVSLDAIMEGKKVLYVDTERGFLKTDIKKLGAAYQYVSNLKAVLDLVQKIPKDIDLFVLDSVGYPVLTEWAKLGVNERGNALTQIIAIKDYIKDWAINNNKVAIVINQPDSDFGKDKDYVNRPFGDKGQFVIKEVFYIERAKASTVDRTVSVLTSFRSRFEGRGTVVAQIEISGDGVKII